MPDYFVHDAGYNIVKGITKSDYDGLNGRVNSLATKVNTIAGGGYGANVYYNGESALMLGANQSGVTFEGSMQAVVDDFYNRIELRGTATFTSYNSTLARNIFYWGIDLTDLHQAANLNMPIMTHVANSEGIVDFTTPARNPRWLFKVPDMPTVAPTPGSGVRDHRWIGHINWYKSGIGEDTGARYYPSGLNGLFGAFNLRTDSNGHQWLIPGAVRMLDSSETRYFDINPLPEGKNVVPYTLANVEHYAGTDNLSGIMLDWEVTLNIVHPGGD